MGFVVQLVFLCLINVVARVGFLTRGAARPREARGLRNEGLRAKGKSDLLLSVFSVLLLILSVCFLFCFGFF